MLLIGQGRVWLSAKSNFTCSVPSSAEAPERLKLASLPNFSTPCDQRERCSQAAISSEYIFLGPQDAHTDPFVA
jgi:hypothetical protein